MNTNQIKQCKPKYTLEFKQDSSKLVLEKVSAHQQAADNLGISLSAIGRWVRSERGSTTDGETKINCPSPKSRLVPALPIMIMRIVCN
ncbi:hypothetical protein [Nitrosomonas supralitoralis]|uniref:Transposase n=1 Tax=Nitrosomonas supralitoralis TaxID=2116706 RepID=A0A2P7NRM5_9PROT|nr:hypothetical protein [Nitrosomonas supralitoralis]PSJ16088.1 hypothetical protein C7H79_15440 [Nitrosomonas supralitoralis]